MFRHYITNQKMLMVMEGGSLGGRFDPRLCFGLMM